jgi:hypothetical protein
MQPLAHSPIAATQMVPMMPRAGEEKKEVKGETQQRAKAPPPQKRAPTRAEAVRAARARTRRESLRKQRDAQKS